MTVPTHPTPDRFMHAVSAFQETGVLKAAIDLNVFTAIGEGNTTAAELAGRCGAAERGMRSLCDYLVVMGFLTKAEGRYSLTPDAAAFLDRKSPAYQGAVLQFLASPMMIETWMNAAEAVRKGRSAVPGEGSMDPEHPIWVEFARSMVAMMGLPSQLLAARVGGDRNRPLKVLDIAAGHGLFGITIARQYPHASVVAIDWAPVLQVAQENAVTAGVQDRWQALPGSAFDVPFGSDYDVVLLTNILHHFDPPTCERLLQKVRAALGPNGRAMVMEFVPAEDRVSPPWPAGFSMTMLLTTAAGDAYPYSEWEKMFANAGYSRSEFCPLHPTPQSLIIGYV